jgi:hypothetical protein
MAVPASAPARRRLRAISESLNTNGKARNYALDLTAPNRPTMFLRPQLSPDSHSDNLKLDTSHLHGRRGQDDLGLQRLGGNQGSRERHGATGGDASSLTVGRYDP